MFMMPFERLHPSRSASSVVQSGNNWTKMLDIRGENKLRGKKVPYSGNAPQLSAADDAHRVAQPTYAHRYCEEFLTA